MEPAVPDGLVCAKCGSHHLLHDLSVPLGNGKLHCEAGAEKLGFLLLSRVTAEITATVCVDCGYTELHVKDPSELRRVYNQKR